MRERARSLESTGAEGAEESRNLIARSLERDVEAISSALMFAPGNDELSEKVEGLIDQLSGAWLLLTGQLTEQRKGNKIIFTIEPKDPSKDKSKKPNPKDASRPRTASPDTTRVPERRVTGPMNVYYYDYVADRASPSDLRVVERLGAREGGDIVMYEILNLVDGKRSVQAIRDYIAAAYGPVPVEDVVDYLRMLEKIGVVKM